MKGNRTNILLRCFRSLVPQVALRGGSNSRGVVLLPLLLCFCGCGVVLWFLGHFLRFTSHISYGSLKGAAQRLDQCQIPISYNNADEREGRVHRFPSIEERIQVYMSNWYRVPCSDSYADVSSFQAKDAKFANARIPLRQNTAVYDSYVVGEKHVAVTTITGQEKQATTSRATSRYFRIANGTLPARIFYVHGPTLSRCANNNDPSNHMRFYCRDMIRTVFPLLQQRDTGAITKAAATTTTTATAATTTLQDWTWQGIPIFYQFGDATESRAPPSLESQSASQSTSTSPLLSQPRIPHMKKFRLAINRRELSRITARLQHLSWMSVEEPWKEDCTTISTTLVPKTVRGAQRLQPIIWKLNIKRHFGYLYQVPCADSPWSMKKDMAIFRGKLNGDLKKAATVDNHLQRCFMLDRCKLVWKYQQSALIDARLTSTMNVIPNVMEGIDVTAPVLSMSEMLSYKGIIVLEGNDVSSGLKNALLSSSVVLMPEPLFTSWAMEELLEPWIHYIPLLPDLSDVEAKVQWMLHHDAEAQRISYRASLWIKDLVFHPMVPSDETIIMQSILERYAQHFDLIRSNNNGKHQF